MNTAINYIEFNTSNLELVKQFYSSAFGWQFTDYGSEYTAFSNAGIEGGFALTDVPFTSSVLVVLYNNDLEAILDIVKTHGGKITQEIFSFPGGRRFHFIDPVGNELAIWSE